MGFNARLDAAIAAKGHFLCVGLDPIYSELPERFRDDSVESSLLSFNHAIIDATAPHAVAFKLQMKVYTAEGPAGYRALIETCRYLKATYPQHLLILDAKYGDVSHVIARVAEEAFEICQADAVTAFAHPGREALAPLLARPDRGCFLVCRTSNPGAAEFQDVALASGEPYYLYMARQAAVSWNANGNCGLVVGATWPAEMAAIRAAAPDLPFLVPGLGAQGGDLAGSVAAGRTAGGGGLLISASRGVMQAAVPAQAAAEYVTAMQAAMVVGEQAPAARQDEWLGVGGRRSDDEEGAGPRPPAPDDATQHATRNTQHATRNTDLDSLLVDLFDAGIIRFERITLKSGRVSPYYHNLRGLVARPALLGRVAQAYAARLGDLGWQPEILIGIAYAGIPLAVALGLEAGLPAGYVRAEAKGYGTRQMVEGPWQAGLRAVLIDDVISDGASKLEVQAPLREAGLAATDMLVFVDRGQGGMETLRAAGLNPQAVTTMAHTLAVLHAAGRISAAQVAESEAFMRGE